MDDPHASVGLGVAYADRATAEVDVMPIERLQLSLAQAGKYKRRDHRTTQADLSSTLPIKLTCSVEERSDVFCPIKPRAAGLHLWQTSLATFRWVAHDQLVFDGRLQDRRERCEYFVD
ncbi:MAG TPA: hypothetical protein VHT29_03720 [Solirubrobacteraceae bacterium]|nr:hypothetical protein [Solirubrobacteraceae bacterium]